MKTTTLYHPTLASGQVEVADSEVAAWTDQGWRKSKPAGLEDAGEPSPSTLAKKAPAKKAAKKAAAPAGGQ